MMISTSFSYTWLGVLRLIWFKCRRTQKVLLISKKPTGFIWLTQHWWFLLSIKHILSQLELVPTTSFSNHSRSHIFSSCRLVQRTNTSTPISFCACLVLRRIAALACKTRIVIHATLSGWCRKVTNYNQPSITRCALKVKLKPSVSLWALLFWFRSLVSFVAAKTDT